MNFNELKEGIQKLSDSFRQNVTLAVNTHLTVRNWLTGFYIVEFEQNGEDRAKYGTKLLQNLADGFSEDRLSYRNLCLYRPFYLTYLDVCKNTALIMLAFFSNGLTAAALNTLFGTLHSNNETKTIFI